MCIRDRNLVIRNWFFGYYIVEFEQNGKEYAQYGNQLLNKLSKELKAEGISGVSYTNLTLCRKLFFTYPQFAEIASPLLIDFDVKKVNRNLQPLAEDFKKWQIKPQKLLKSLSFSHFSLLLKVEDPIQRLFYEIECIKGNWSRRQLQRQIGSLLYERTGLSNNKKALLEQLEENPSSPDPIDVIRDPYVFEFLGLKPKEVFFESDLEEALLNHLQQFLLELGNGFCLEARQKSLSLIHI